MKQDRKLLEQNLIKPTLEVKRRRGVVKDIKRHLSENYSIFDGSIQTWINNPAEELKEIDPRLLYLFAEQIYQKTGDPNIAPEEYFTEQDIKRSKQFSGKLYVEDEIKFPIKFQPSIEVSRDSWSTTIDIKFLVQLLKARLLNWNPESQREATYKVVNGEVIEEATLYMENVIEMKNLLKQSKLKETQLTFNCSVGTSDGDEEVIYDKNNFELQIQKGTKIDIIDGYHRIKASELALAENPNLEFTFELKILNYTVDRAAEYLAQISKRTPISETKRKTMAKDTYTDMIIDELRRSKLGERISKKEMLTSARKELVTYNTLSYAIDKFFKVESKSDMFSVSDYLTEAFDIFLEVFEEEIIDKYSETKQKSLISNNNMFIGYVLLLSRMKTSNIEARKMVNYIRKIDFSKDNPMWKEVGVLDEKERLVKNPRIGIEEVFSSIQL